MESFLRDGVASIPMDFQSVTSTINEITNSNIGVNIGISGDAHFFEDTTSPAAVKDFLNSTKVSINLI
jgi:hypothetical protein